jgi:hypothetical protein
LADLLPDGWSISYEEMPLGNDCRLSLALDGRGVSHVYLLVPDGDDDQGCADCALHERGGPLPPDWQARVDRVTSRTRVSSPRCGRPRRDGQPCQTIVDEAGEPCHWHKGQSEQGRLFS